MGWPFFEVHRSKNQLSIIMKENFSIPDPINKIARDKFGIDYVFPFQRLVISNILRAGKIPGFETDPDFEEELAPRQIVLLPTGAGKSLCFMLPAFLLDGITLVIFPLLSLLSDQLRRTEECGLNAAILRGGQSETERDKILEKCREGRIKMILTNPETLLNESVLKNLKGLDICHAVIDETHTVSEWGDSFRPAYLELGSILKEISPDLITAFTATASQHILDRIKEVLFPEETPNVVYGNPDRANIAYSVIKTEAPDRTILELVERSEKPLIIFSSSRTATELNARMLRRELNNNEVFFYHAGLEKEEKEHIEQWFFQSDEGILSATCAYGMGVDKKNIRTVIHTEPPSTVESYLQESGRAGRDRNPAQAYLIYTDEAKRRLSIINNPLSRKRYISLINYCENKSECRRESLLAMLNSEPEICSGCDVCNGSSFIPFDSDEILRIVKKNKGRFSKRTFIHFLKGYRTGEIVSSYKHEIQGFGLLNNWKTEMIEEMIGLMIKAGTLSIPSKGIRKHRLTV